MRAGRHQRITSLGRRGDRVELRGDQLGRAPGQVRRRRGVAPVTIGRTGWPTGTSGTPTPASRSANSSSGGAHTRTCAPSARNRTASPTIGSTSPREPYVDNNTRISRLPFPQVLASASDCAARSGSCRKPALFSKAGSNLLRPRADQWLWSSDSRRVLASPASGGEPAITGRGGGLGCSYLAGRWPASRRGSSYLSVPLAGCLGRMDGARRLARRAWRAWWPRRSFSAFACISLMWSAASC